MRVSLTSLARVTAALLVVAATARAQSPDSRLQQIAWAHAPIIIAEMDAHPVGSAAAQDQLLRFDFDGDMNASNNTTSSPGNRTPSVYYSITETADYFYIGYYFYHAKDGGIQVCHTWPGNYCTDWYGHINDLEGYWVAVKKETALSPWGISTVGLTVAHGALIPTYNVQYWGLNSGPTVNYLTAPGTNKSLLTTWHWIDPLVNMQRPVLMIRARGHGTYPAQNLNAALPSFSPDPFYLNSSILSSSSNVHGGLQFDRVYWQNEVYLGGNRYYHAVGMHAAWEGVSTAVFNIPAGATRFTADFGFARQDGYDQSGNADGRVYADGSLVWSGHLSGGTYSGMLLNVSVAIPATATQLRLEVDNGGDGTIYGDHTTWGNAAFSNPGGTMSYLNADPGCGSGNCGITPHNFGAAQTYNQITHTGLEIRYSPNGNPYCSLTGGCSETEPAMNATTGDFRYTLLSFVDSPLWTGRSSPGMVWKPYSNGNTIQFVKDDGSPGNAGQTEMGYPCFNSGSDCGAQAPWAWVGGNSGCGYGACWYHFGIDGKVHGNDSGFGPDATEPVMRLPVIGGGALLVAPVHVVNTIWGGSQIGAFSTEWVANPYRLNRTPPSIGVPDPPNVTINGGTEFDASNVWAYFTATITGNNPPFSRYWTSDSYPPSSDSEYSFPVHYSQYVYLDVTDNLGQHSYTQKYLHYCGGPDEGCGSGGQSGAVRATAALPPARLRPKRP